MALHVITPGLQTLAQDYGRYGYKHNGITHGGPMDEHAFLWANRLLDNDYNATQCEILYGGFGAIFTEPTIIALCGADLDAKLIQENQTVAIKPWQSYNVARNTKIVFAKPITGLRTYLAVKGGFQFEQKLGSSSTVLREGIGGQALKKEQVIAYNTVDVAASSNVSVPPTYIPEYTNDFSVRFYKNQSSNGVLDKTIEQFSKRQFEVTQESDRMGYRLAGEPLQTEKRDMLSQGVSVGTIQLPPDGQPIVLMRDHQTMGGYPIIGCLNYLDIAKLAQAKPGARIKFKAINIEQGIEALHQYKHFFKVPF